MKAAITNAEKEVTKLKKNGGHTGAGGQPQYTESQKLIHELYFANEPNETTTVLYKDLNNKTQIKDYHSTVQNFSILLRKTLLAKFASM